MNPTTLTLMIAQLQAASYQAEIVGESIWVNDELILRPILAETVIQWRIETINRVGLTTTPAEAVLSKMTFYGLTPK